ncbi:unnamed protein product [Mytilus edulis]|uniref:Uncharacterized protein n=1 Tax=Mytilus edulis TaxID=6550 RepID=A0A8S3R428_MYTED|nr:unnamed protein product [Mytilus edulis]
MEQVPRLVCEYVRQGHDPLHMYQGKRIEYSDSLVSDFPNSPTALKCKAAYEMFQKARLILDQYSKAGVDTESDCNFLQPAFQGYSKAYMCGNVLYDRFKPPDNTPELVDQYLKHRPDDILSEFCKHIFVTKSHHNGSEFSKFKHVQMAIRAYEIFALKVQEANTTSTNRRQILNTVYTRLGSLYSTTEQKIRAKDSFQKHMTMTKGIMNLYLVLRGGFGTMIQRRLLN